MPRLKSAVKTKLAESVGIVDLHFHGAFGLDLMSASRSDLNFLSQKLWQEGVGAFCPTTLSSSFEELLSTVENLGSWIRSDEAPGARPLGIHLEGPFIHPGACGAHPIEWIRPFRQADLEKLWKLSQGTLKILTIAPEKLTAAQLKTLTSWARKNRVVLSVGHSRATEAEASNAFSQGFSGVTHAWNAMNFHHRSPGILGAALGRKGIHVELILDQVHVAPTLIDWMNQLHPEGLCYVSDAVPPAGTEPGRWHSFGPLKARLHQGACRLKDGSLAGGGFLLPHAYSSWLSRQDQSPAELRQALKKSLGRVTTDPLKALGLGPSALKNRRISWEMGRQDGRLTAIPRPL